MLAGKVCITAVRQQQKHPERVNIYLDGKFWKSVSKEVAVSLNLQEELKVESKDLERIVLSEEKKKAIDYSMKLLGFRSRSVKELENRLGKAGFSQDTLIMTIDYLKEQGYLNDAAFANMWIDERLRLKSLGRNRLRQELIEKGIDKKIIDEQLSNYSDENELEHALSCARKKYEKARNLDPKKSRQRIYQFLLYKGFDSAVAAEVVGKISSMDNEDLD